MMSSTLIVALTAVGVLAGAAGGPIHDAARDGDLARVEQLIEGDPKLVHSQDDQHYRALDWAASRGHKDVMAFLLDHGADPNARADRGMTPLLGVKDGRKDLTELLEAHGADLRAKADDGWSALHNAARGGSEESVAYLIAKGLVVDDRCQGPCGTPLTVAAAGGRVGVARLLLAKGADVNVRSDSGDTPLHEAAWRGHAEMVGLLLGQKAVVDPRHGKRPSSPGLGEAGGTPLDDAVQCGHEEVVRLLIDRGADVKSRSDSGKTPLHMATTKGGAGIVKRLLDAGADVDAFSDAGLTPLHEMATRGDVGSATLLLDRGADIDSGSKRSTLTPIVRSQTTKRQSWDNTPLHLAVMADRPDMVKLLLSRKAEVDPRNSLERTPLQLARSEEVKTMLREAGARDE